MEHSENASLQNTVKLFAHKEDLFLTMISTTNLYGKCDHFIIELERQELHCYIATEFRRRPVQSYIAMRDGPEERVSGEPVFTSIHSCFFGFESCMIR